ncbi:MAG: IclR family transcriptional regulator [Actinomycetota bacterium]|nr:IclR family transcriptional regulator [Actinomycetota bacterium]MDH5314583.1 IclR family transcriptional regulator [Actinomycetota bacterium]
MRDQKEVGGNLQSVRRALRALELISEHGELGVTELGRKLEVHKATASRLIATLAERNFVERDPISEKYRLGFGLISLAGAAVGGNDLVRAARPILDDLAERTRETVNLGVLSGESVVYVDQVTGTRSIVSVSWVGQRTPLHCTSNGKVLLAYATDAERDRLLRVPLPRLTPRTITDVKKLRTQLSEIRVRGFSQTMEELEEGLNAVAAPVKGMGGDLVAALSVSGPAFRMRAVDLPRLGKLTADAALAVSRRLGYVDRGARAV